MKMKSIFIFLILISKISFAQTNENFPSNFIFKNHLNTENILYKYSQFNFSDVWLKTDNNNIYGIIGDENQRISIKLLFITKNINQYFVSGKIMVKKNICDFHGLINLTKIYKFKNMHFGVDNEYAGKGIKSEGVLIADYEFKEDRKQINNGIFKGRIYTKFYLNSNNKIEYDDIEVNSDNYFNNAFVGNWKNYNRKNSIKCNWADYRVPNSEKGFDIGIGEINVYTKYANKGWIDVILKNQMPNLNVIKSQTSKESKEWWE